MNARDELLKMIEGRPRIICAKITLNDLSFYDEDEIRRINLRLGYSEQDYAEFLRALDFEYNNGYGGQELFGKVWLQNNAWLERHEYDGSEWWEYKCFPSIPVELWSENEEEEL